MKISFAGWVLQSLLIWVCGRVVPSVQMPSRFNESGLVAPELALSSQCSNYSTYTWTRDHGCPVPRVTVHWNTCLAKGI